MQKKSGINFLEIVSRLKLFVRFLFLINVLLSLYTFVGYISIHVSPSDFWLAGFFTLSLQIMLVINAAFFFWWFFKKRYKKMLVSLFTLLAGYPLIQRTITYHNVEIIPANRKSFEILSYNVRLFNNDIFYNQKKGREEPDKIINWVASNSADVKCIQEFYHKDKSTIFNSIDKINYNGNYYYFMTPFKESLRTEYGFYGLAVFSKFPIVNSGEIIFEKRSINKGIFADITIDNDTIRLLNIHLASNHVVPDSLFDQTDKAEFEKEYTNLFQQLKHGFSARGKQASTIEKAIIDSPYPVILCGDFNDTPYSYAYQRIRKYLENAFEEKGNGFGFTYNGKLPIRIDNQFYDHNFKIFEFKTYDGVKYSDHFPISARYTIETNQEISK